MAAPGKSKIPPQSTAPQGREDSETRVIPVVEEEVAVSRVTEKTGKRVRVRIVAREEKQRIPVTETVEAVSVERVPINRYVKERTATREEGGVVIVPVFETVQVVEERLLLKEEVRIIRHRREVQREEEVVLRKETPIIERRASNQDEWNQEPPDQ